MSSKLFGHLAQEKEFKGLADRQALGHGYLFFGQPRIGKRLFAAALARYLEHGVFSPEAGDSPVLADALEIGPAEGSIGIDEVRKVKNFLWQLPNKSRHRTVIVNEAELLTNEAQNALLKITEEPSSTALLILVARDPEELLPTLVSRLRKTFFAPLSARDMQEWLSALKIPAAKAKELRELSMGQPGLAARLLSDDGFRNLLAQAREFLSANPLRRKDLVKELAADEAFDFTAFLEAVMIVLAPALPRNPRLWHALLGLRREATSFNLNPRLQLMALGRFLI